MAEVKPTIDQQAAAELFDFGIGEKKRLAQLLADREAEAEGETKGER